MEWASPSAGVQGSCPRRQKAGIFWTIKAKRKWKQRYGKLKGEFGYLARTEVVKKVLNGTYSYATDFDEATREYMQECERTRAIVPEIQSTQC